MIEPPKEVKWWNPFSWSEATAYSGRLDEQRERLNQDAAETYGPEWLAQTEANTASGKIDAAGEIAGEFSPEALAGNLADSAKAAGNAVGSVVSTVSNAAGSFVLRSLLGIPVWLWLIALSAGALWFGWPVIVARLARRK